MSILRKLAVALAVLSGLLVVAAGIAYAMFDAAAIKRQLIEQVAAKTGRSLRIDGEVGLSLWPEVAVSAGQVGLSEADGKTAFASLAALRVAVAVMPLLAGRVEARQIEIDGLALTLVKRRDGSLNIDDLRGGSAKPASAAADSAATSGGSQPLQLDIAGLALRDARFTWRDEAAGKLSQLSAVDFSTGRIQADGAAGRLSIADVRLALRGSSGDDRVDAGIELPSLQLDGQQLSTAFAGTLALSSPALPMRSIKLPLAGKLAADLGKSTAALTLQTSLDASKIALNVTVDRLSPLFFNADLKIDQLNVDHYLPPARSGAAPTPAGQGSGGAGGAKPAGRIDLTPLEGLNFRGQVAVGQLQVRGLKLSALDMKLAAGAGRLDIVPLRARLYGGSLDGALGVSARGNVFTVRQNLNGIDIRPLLADVLGKEPLEGRGSVAIDVNTRGQTVDALKRGLAGQASLALRDGAIRGVNLAKQLRDAKAVLRGGKSAASAAEAAEKTDFSELTASFRIAGGVAHNDDLAMKSPFLRLGGAGDIDIGNGRIDYLARVSVVETSKGQAGKERDELRGITVPVRLRGPFDDLSYTLEVDALLKDAAKAKLDEKKAELKEKAGRKLEEKLGDKLKGLFGK